MRPVKNSRSILNTIQNKSILLVCSHSGKKRIKQDIALKSFIVNNTIHWVSDVKSNPDVIETQKMLSDIPEKYDMCVSIGGGSVIDTAKILNSVKNTSLVDGKNIFKDTIPKHYAIPTTCGTGSEATQFATLWSSDNKYSIEDDRIVPSNVILDPVLIEALPKEIKLQCSLDALCQACDSIWNKNRTEESLKIAFDCYKISTRSILNHLNGIEENANLLYASYLSGVSISKTKTSLTHSLSYPLTYKFGIQHGLACAFTLLSVYDFNSKNDEISRLIERDKLEQILHTAEVKSKCKALLGSYENLKSCTQEMKNPNRFKNNIRKITDNGINKILKQSYF